MRPLTDSEKSLIESGAATFAEVLRSRRELAEAKAAEAEEVAEGRFWDSTHCLCGELLSAPCRCEP
jgi:hypothetical protein